MLLVDRKLEVERCFFYWRSIMSHEWITIKCIIILFKSYHCNKMFALTMLNDLQWISSQEDVIIPWLISWASFINEISGVFNPYLPYILFYF